MARIAASWRCRRSSPIEANGRHGEGIALRSTHFGSAQNVLQVIPVERARVGNVMPMIIIVVIDCRDSPHDPPLHRSFWRLWNWTCRSSSHPSRATNLLFDENCDRFFCNKNIKESIFPKYYKILTKIQIYFKLNLRGLKIVQIITKHYSSI